MTHLHRNTSASKAELAHAASCELTYILTALGLQDDLEASSALRRALESRSSLKDAARATANTLRRIKLAVRHRIDASKAVSRDKGKLAAELHFAAADRDSARANLRRTERDLTNAKGLLRDSLADNAELVTSRDFWKVKADPHPGISDEDWELLGKSGTTTDPDTAGKGSAVHDNVELSLIEDHAQARRRAAKVAADDAQRARERSARRQTIRDRDETTNTETTGD